MLAQPNTLVGITITGVTYTPVSQKSGVVPSADEDEFVSQDQWNIDTMDGLGTSMNPSGVKLDVTKGNVFQIQTQYLGFGGILYSVENPRTGFFQ